MTPSESRILRLISAAFLVLPVSASLAEDAKPAAPVVDTASVGTGLTSFGRQIPAQRPNLGIYIPSFSGGKPSSIIEAEVLTRIDDSRLQAQAMTIRLFGDEAADQITVDMPSATYNMTNQILRSSQRSKVSRTDFDLEGDILIFDTTTSQGRMTGNVRMTIHDAGAFMKNNAVDAIEKPAPTAPAPEVQPAPPSPAPPLRSTPSAATPKAKPQS